jgi:hypothetical protein
MARVVIGTITDVCDFTIVEEEYVQVKSSSIREFMRVKMFEFIDECHRRSLPWNASMTEDTRIFFNYETFVFDEFDTLEGRGEVTVNASVKFGKPSAIFFVLDSMEVYANKKHDEKTSDEIAKCVACAENKKNIVLSCGHMSTCGGCSAKIDRCPICRAKIETKTRVFW